jgi:hypothetical protein
MDCEVFNDLGLNAAIPRGNINRSALCFSVMHDGRQKCLHEADGKQLPLESVYNGVVSELSVPISSSWPSLWDSMYMQSIVSTC